MERRSTYVNDQTAAPPSTVGISAPASIQVAREQDGAATLLRDLAQSCHRFAYRVFTPRREKGVRLIEDNQSHASLNNRVVHSIEVLGQPDYRQPMMWTEDPSEVGSLSFQAGKDVSARMLLNVQPKRVRRVNEIAIEIAT